MAQKTSVVDNNVVYAKKVLTLSLLSIIIAAPIGAVFIIVFGPKLLKKNSEGNQDNLEEKNSTCIHCCTFK